MKSKFLRSSTITLLVFMACLFAFSSEVFAGDFRKELSLAYRELATPYKYREIIKEAALKYNLDPNLLGLIIRYESGFNRSAVSSAGAKGLMQIMGFNFRFLGIRDPFNPRENVMGGTKYIAYLLQMWEGNVELALASYNAGPGRVKSWVAKAGSTDWQIVKHYAYPGTRNYIDKKIIPGWTASFPKVVSRPSINLPTEGDIYSGGDINVAWNHVPGATGYLISVRDLTSDIQMINNTFIDRANDYLIPDSLLTNGHEYRIAVAAISREGGQQWREINLLGDPRERLIYYFLSRLPISLEDYRYIS